MSPPQPAARPRPRAPAAGGRELGWLAVWLLATLGLRPLLLPDEGRYAGVAWEMLQGDHLVPTLAGLPFFHKPPLLYWLDLLPMALLGATDVAARIGPAALAWLLGASLFWHLRRWHGVAVARTGLAVLATSPLFFIGGQYVNHDIGAAACITAAVLATVRALDDDPRRVSRRWQVAAWALCGLGVLAKGLIGLVLPALVVVPWLLALKRWRQLPGLLHPRGLLAFAAVVAPWMGWMEWRHPGFFDYFIVEQHFRRFTGSTFNNRMPFWFYAAVLPLALLPWSAWLWPALRQRGAKAGLYFWWVAAVVGFFSLPASKLVGYVMPALAPAAALLALALAARRTAWRPVVAVTAAALVLLVAVVGWKSPGSHRELAHELAARLDPADRVAFIDAYYYDLPYYARLARPVPVVSDWSPAEVARRDNWRKELSDAARFSADGGRSVLWDWSRLPDLVCTPGRLWVLANEAQTDRLAAALPALALVRKVNGVQLLQMPGRRCAGADPPA